MLLVRGVEQIPPQTSQALHVVRRGHSSRGTQWTCSVVYVIAVKRNIVFPNVGGVSTRNSKRCFNYWWLSPSLVNELIP